jgi:hypothetical protein
MRHSQLYYRINVVVFAEMADIFRKLSSSCPSVHLTRYFSTVWHTQFECACAVATVVTCLFSSCAYSNQHHWVTLPARERPQRIFILGFVASRWVVLPSWNEWSSAVRDTFVCHVLTNKFEHWLWARCVFRSNPVFAVQVIWFLQLI